MNYVLDTHILVWWLEAQDRLSPPQEAAVQTAAPGHPLLVSDFTLWEIACLHSLGRLAFSIPLADWLEQAVAPPLVRVCAVTPAIAAQSATLPASFHRDPGDRVIVSTALATRARLVTSDRKIIDAGLVDTVH